MESTSSKNSVFVGNIPYDVTEDDLINLFRQFGEVVKFRLVIDPGTGKGKGYGFCDFATIEAAEAAKKMNNILPINGRTLRVDSASQAQPSGGGGNRPYSAMSASNANSVKQGRDLDTALSQLTMGEVYDILVEVKAWVKKDPDGVRELLAQRPVLAQALLKMQTSMGMMQTSPPADLSFGAFSGMSASSTTPSPTPPIQSMSAPPPQLVSSIPSLIPQVPTYAQQPQYYPQMPYGMAQYAPMAPQPQLLPGLNAPIHDPQQDILRRILTMSEEEVAQLNQGEQAQVRSIRMQYNFQGR
jgi:cleavage stimulation factor subunit 2